MSDYEVRKVGDPEIIMIISDWRDFRLGRFPCQGRDLSNGFQVEELDQRYTLTLIPPSPPPPIPHNIVVEDAARDLLNAHLTEAQAAQVTSRLIRILGIAVVTGQPIPTTPVNKQQLANHGSLALDWRADVLKERDRAISAGDDPVFPVWDDTWDDIYAVI